MQMSVLMNYALLLQSAEDQPVCGQTKKNKKRMYSRPDH